MKKFTGDKWKFFSKYEIVEAFDENGKYICDIADISNVDMPFLNPVNRDWKADARLIASAPEMYNFLSQLVSLNDIPKNAWLDYEDVLRGLFTGAEKLLNRIDSAEEKGE